MRNTGGESKCFGLDLELFLVVLVDYCHYLFEDKVVEGFHGFVLERFCSFFDVGDVFIDFSESFAESGVEFIFDATITFIRHFGGHDGPFVTCITLSVPYSLCS